MKIQSKLKLNNKGFTLIELIVVIAIIAAIMIFTLPNITSNIEKNKMDSVINDAKSFIDKTKVVLNNNPAFYPQDSEEASIFYLSFVDKEEQITKSKYGYDYSRDESYVKVSKDGTFSVYLVACEDLKEKPINQSSKSVSITSSTVWGRYKNKTTNTDIIYDLNRNGYLDDDDTIESNYKTCKSNTNKVVLDANENDLNQSTRYKKITESTDSLGSQEWESTEVVFGYVKQ